MEGWHEGELWSATGCYGLEAGRFWRWLLFTWLVVSLSKHLAAVGQEQTSEGWHV